MFRLLLVEDVEATLEQLTALLLEEFEQSLTVDGATNVADGLGRIEQANTSLPYDVAILDFKLPTRTGHMDEIDESLCLAIRDLSPDTLVIHITAYPDDQKVKNHLARHHTGPEDAPAALVSKLEADWPEQLVACARTFLYSQRVSAQLDDLSSQRPRKGGAHRERVGSEQPQGDRSLTHTLARLLRDIVAYWPHLSETVKRRVRTLFNVDESQEPILVKVKKPSQGSRPGGDHVA